MISIYEKNQTGVPTHTGIGALRPSKCIAAEEVNGKFELTMEHPVDDEGKWARIENGRIIKAPTNRGYQLFRVYRSVKNPITGYYNVNARHISYDLMDNLLEDVNPTAKTGQQAGDMMLSGCQFPSGFSFSSDISALSSANYVRVNPIAAFIGNNDDAFIKKWGGEIIRDNYSIAINTRIGANNGVRIAYGKNLTGLEATIDEADVITRIMPTAIDAEGATLLTAAKYYDSPLISNYPHPKIGILNTGIRVGRKENGVIAYPDNASAQAAMATMAAAAFASGVDKPNVTIKAEFIRWQDTDEYKAYAVLQDVSLGDDVTVYVARMDIDVQLRATAIEWDCINDKPNKVTLGDKATNLAKSVVDIDIDVSALKDSTARALNEGEIYYGAGITHKDGFTSQATIGGNNIFAKFNASQIGFYDASNKLVGGMALVNSVLAMIAGILTNDINGDCYATIGNIVEGGITYRGVAIYLKSLSTTTPAVGIYVSSYSGGRFFIKTYDGITLGMNSNFPLTLTDANGVQRVRVSSIATQLWDANNEMRLEISSSDTVMWSPDGSNGIGASNVNPYYVKDYEVHYF